MVWAVVIVGAIVLFCLPVLVAAIRGTDQLWLVVLLTLLTPLGGVTWVGAWIVALAFPRRRPAPARRSAPLAREDDPTCLFGGVPPADTVVLARRPAGSGVSVWS